jgi:hypothetical protein
MTIPLINQKADLEIIIMRHHFRSPSFLYLHSSRLMREIGLSSNPGQVITSVMNNLGRTTIKMAQEYAYPTERPEIKSPSDALKMILGVNGDLQAAFNDAIKIVKAKDSLEFALAEIPVCWALTLDFGKNAVFPKIDNDARITNGYHGFFTPGRIVQINALPKKMLPDVIDPYIFNVVGR